MSVSEAIVKRYANTIHWTDDKGALNSFWRVGRAMFTIEPSIVPRNTPRLTDAATRHLFSYTVSSD